MANLGVRKGREENGRGEEYREASTLYFLSNKCQCGKMFKPECQAVGSEVTSIFSMPVRMFKTFLFVGRGSIIVIWRVPAQRWPTADHQQMGFFLTAGCWPLDTLI